MTDSLSYEQKHRMNASPMHVLRNRNFRLLWIGEGISLLGDQFHLIALPWLVLSLTGDALAVGTVLATAGIPRALLLLVRLASNNGDQHDSMPVQLADQADQPSLIHDDIGERWEPSQALAQ